MTDEVTTCPDCGRPIGAGAGQCFDSGYPIRDPDSCQLYQIAKLRAELEEARAELARLRLTSAVYSEEQQTADRAEVLAYDFGPRLSAPPTEGTP